MPKLILKQHEPTKSSWLTQYGSQIAYAGFIVLLLLVSMGILFTFKPTSKPDLPPPNLESATDLTVKVQYLSDWSELKRMQENYERLAKDTSSYEKSLVLLNQAEMVWQHLLIMSESVDKLGLNEHEKKALEEEQAYLQDQWQSHIHFSELRLDRFTHQKQNAAAELVPVAGDVVTKTASSATTATQAVLDSLPNSKYIAAPPAGVELPAGFCTLDGSGTCKPAANN